MKLVEECVGEGDLLQGGQLVRRVRYQISRYQAMLESGMPIVGRHRIEGTIDPDSARSTSGLVGEPLTLKLEDGRSVAVTLADADGRLLAEGHGLKHGCGCC